MPQKRVECFTLLFDHLASIKHQFLSSIRNSRKLGSLWGMMRGVGGVRKSIHQSWLAKELGLGLLCWGVKGVQEEIRSEEASTLPWGLREVVGTLQQVHRSQRRLLRRGLEFHVCTVNKSAHTKKKKKKKTGKLLKALHIHVYMCVCMCVCWPTIVEGDPKPLFSITTTPRCKGRRYSFP